MLSMSPICRFGGEVLPWIKTWQESALCCSQKFRKMVYQNQLWWYHLCEEIDKVTFAQQIRSFDVDTWRCPLSGQSKFSETRLSAHAHTSCELFDTCATFCKELYWVKSERPNVSCSEQGTTKLRQCLNWFSKQMCLEPHRTDFSLSKWICWNSVCKFANCVFSSWMRVAGVRSYSCISFSQALHLQQNLVEVCASFCLNKVKCLWNFSRSGLTAMDICWTTPT